MAIIFREYRDGVCYEVKNAGKTLRLYTDGVFHSQFHPDHLLTGSVWDLLMLPAFLKPADEIKRVLVLGVGGGAVIHQLNRFIAPERIVGIELNRNHIQIARKYFHLNQANVFLYEADAVEWVKAYRGPGFDMIIDDLFFSEQGEAKRVLPLDKVWFEHLADLLNPDGLMVVNCATPQELASSAYFHKPSVKRQFESAFRFSTPYCENAVGVFAKESYSLKAFNHNISKHVGLQKARKRVALRYAAKLL